MKKRVFIIYHYPCTDGAFAALAVWLSKKDNHDISFFPHSTITPLILPEDPTAEVFILDYSGPEGFMAQCAQRYQSIHFIDHHKSAEHYKFPGLFDLERSGCMLAYSYCQPAISPELLRIFQYVQDNDLWRHALPNTREFTAGFRNECYSLDFATHPTMLETLQSLDFDQLVESGKLVLEKQAKLIQQYVFRSKRLHIHELDIDVQYVELDPADHDITSQLGHELAKFNGMGAIGIPIKEGVWKVSIRGFNCVRVSVHYGGGGHDGAAGFTLPMNPMEAWKL